MKTPVPNFHRSHIAHHVNMGKLGDAQAGSDAGSPLDSTADLATAALPGRRRFRGGKPYEKGHTVSEWISWIEEYEQCSQKWNLADAE
jgi:hypothetical protein